MTYFPGLVRVPRGILAHMRVGCGLVLLVSAAVLPLRAQDSTAATPPSAISGRRPTRSFLSRGEIVLLSSFALGTAIVSPFDQRWTSQLQRADLQADRRLSRSADVVRTLGDPGALLISGSLFAVGRLSHHPGLTDAGLHATEAVIASGVAAAILKGLVGRARPLTVQNADADEYLPGRGYRGGYSSMPSGHTTVAFAAAASFGSELGRSHPRVARFVTPLLYTAATLVGASRLYNDQHWASDVVVAGALGTLVGRRLVGYAHATPTSRLNGWRLPLTVGLGHGGAPVAQLHIAFR